MLGKVMAKFSLMAIWILEITGHFVMWMLTESWWRMQTSWLGTIHKIFKVEFQSFTKPYMERPWLDSLYTPVPQSWAGPPRGSVGPGAKYLFGGPDDVIMYSSGTRVYWKRGRTLRSSALKSSDCIFRGLLGHSPEKILNLGSLKWNFLHFASFFEQNLTTPAPPSRRPWSWVIEHVVWWQWFVQVLHH